MIREFPFFGDLFIILQAGYKVVPFQRFTEGGTSKWYTGLNFGAETPRRELCRATSPPDFFPVELALFAINSKIPVVSIGHIFVQRSFNSESLLYSEGHTLTDGILRQNLEGRLSQWGLFVVFFWRGRRKVIDILTEWLKWFMWTYSRDACSRK